MIPTQQAVAIKRGPPLRARLISLQPSSTIMTTGKVAFSAALVVALTVVSCSARSVEGGQYTPAEYDYGDAGGMYGPSDYYNQQAEDYAAAQQGYYVPAGQHVGYPALPYAGYSSGTDASHDSLLHRSRRAHPHHLLKLLPLLGLFKKGKGAGLLKMLPGLLAGKKGLAALLTLPLELTKLVKLLLEAKVKELSIYKVDKYGYGSYNKGYMLEPYNNAGSYPMSMGSGTYLEAPKLYKPGMPDDSKYPPKPL